MEKVDLDAGVNFWKESKDEMLIELANIVERSKQVPSEEELIEILAFLQTFAMGTMGMALDGKGEIVRPELSDIAEKFNNRESLFRLGLNKMGFCHGKYMCPLQERWIDSKFTRIVKKATTRVAYAMCGK